MTDWWADCNCFGEAGNKNNLKAMVRAQNDIYMVCPDTLNEPHNIIEGLKEGYVTRGELERSASNLLKFIMQTPTFKRYIAGEDMSTEEKIDYDNLVCVYENDSVFAYRPFKIDELVEGDYVLSISLISYADSLAQNRVTVFVDNELFAFSVNGDTGETIQKELKIYIKNKAPEIVLQFPECIKCKKLVVYAEN
jgi:beta-glucosidase